MGKGNSSKVNETQVLMTLGHSNWTACRTDVIKKIPFYPASHNKQFLITPERGRKEGAGAEHGKRELFESE